MSATKLKIIGVVFMCLSIFFAGLSVYLYFQNDSSLAKIKENETKIVQLEADKIPLKATISRNEAEIAEHKKTIARFQANETVLLNLLNSQKNEVDIETRAYFSADDDKRVELFAKLATGQN